MKYEEILEHLAPCGIDCYRCVAYKDGPVGQMASRLKDALTGFERMAAIRSDNIPVLKHYSEFIEILDFLAQGECRGCRKGSACVPFCAAKDCFKEKNVDFCFQCEEYPCSRNSYPQNLAKRWAAYNDRMKEVGVENFYEEQSKKPRY